MKINKGFLPKNYEIPFIYSHIVKTPEERSRETIKKVSAIKFCKDNLEVIFPEEVVKIIRDKKLTNKQIKKLLQ